MANRETNQITLEDATIEIMEHVKEKVDQVFGEKWQGKTEMVLGLTMKITLLQAFDMEWALPREFEALKGPILKNFDPEIKEVENLYLEASGQFGRMGLDEKQAVNEARNQIFMATATVIPEPLVGEIQSLIHTSLGSGSC